MSSTSIEYLIIFIVLAALIVIISSSITRKTPEERGAEGESTVSSFLKTFAPIRDSGHILSNLYIPSGQGDTREVDLLCVTTKGLIVIESKNYAGWIFGSENQQRWTVTLYAGHGETEKYKFFNPIWQNNAHINALKRYLGYDIPILSFIVFSSRGELKSLEYKETHATICYMSELPVVLEEFWENHPDVFTQERVDATANKLEKLADDEEGTKKEAHLKRLNERYSNTEVCPWCGGKLKVRTARQGRNAGKQFYGCSNYPRCRYTKNL